MDVPGGRPQTPARWPALLRRWGGFWLLMIGIAFAAGYTDGYGRFESALVDHITALHGRPAPDDIVIVAIDDRSLYELGRWPWRRSVHAFMLDRLRDARPKAVGLDLIFDEADALYPDDDALLAESIRRNGKVVLPVHMGVTASRPGAVFPIAGLVEAARALGHIHIEVDRDGVGRSVFLREGTTSRQWDHFALALLSVAGEPIAEARLPGVRRPHGRQAIPGDAGWLRDYWMQVPYAGPPGHIRRVSYVDVLDGRVPAEALRDKIILVGASAMGMGDAYPTPTTSENPMHGVEIIANVLDALRHEIDLRRATPWENALFSVFIVALALAALYWLKPRWVLSIIFALMAIAYGLAWLSPRALGIQFVPLAAFACLGLTYPLWSWLRLEAALAYFSKEFRRLREGSQENVVEPASEGDELDRRMLAVATAVEQLRGLQRLVQDSLDSLSDAVLVTNAKGAVLLANDTASRYYGGDQPLRGRDAFDLLRERVVLHGGESLETAFGRAGFSLCEIAVTDAARRDLLLKCMPRNGQGAAAGWILSLVDISVVQAAQRQREEALRFISHDMRSPQSSILTLLELHRVQPTLTDAALYERIEGHARRTLGLADDFVHLTRAQSAEYRFETVNLCDVLIEAVDGFWDRARARDMRIETDMPDEACWSVADGAMLTRALANLIDNALKYSPPGSVVRCGLLRQDEGWMLAVCDEGPGIAPAEQPQIYAAFKRTRGSQHIAGAGLGLAFVKAVVDRHRGRIEIHHPAQGAEFRIFLPN